MGRLRVVALVATLLVIVFGSSAFVYLSVANDNRHKTHEEFDRRVATLNRQALREYARYEDLVQTIGAFFNASDQVDPTEFSMFIEGISTSSVYPGIKGVAYAQLINDSDKAQAASQAQKLGLNFSTTPFSGTGDHAVLLYTNSPSSEVPIGTDAYLVPGGKASLELAAQTGTVVASQPMQYTIDGKKVLGYVYAYPVTQGAPLNLSSTTGGYTGWVLAFIDPVQLWANLASIEGINVEVTDIPADISVDINTGKSVEEFSSDFIIEVGSRDKKAVLTATEDFVNEVDDSSRPWRIAFIVANVQLILILLGSLLYMHKARKKKESKLSFHAAHDALTGLPNRFYLEGWLKEKVKSIGKSDHNVAVLFIDLDGFKAINDTLGHQMGDEFLIAISRRLQNEVRGKDVLARLGGDEFIVVLDDVSDEIKAKRIAQRLIEVIRYPVKLDSGPVCVSASIGIAISPIDANTDSTSVIRFADAAMYVAKEDEEERIRVFDKNLKSVVDGRHEVESSIRGATSRNEIVSVLQPLVDIEGSRTYGYEALCRWNHPGFGLLGPDQFLDAAKVTGEIIEIDRWMVNQAFQNAIDISESLGRGTRVWVNLSVRHLLQGEFHQYVVSALKNSDATADMLGVEIEEEVFKLDKGLLYPFLNEMKELGIAVALDDFGSNEASLQALKRYPYDEIKLDRTIINEFVQSPNTSIVPAVIELAKSKGMTVVAAGVETPDMLQAVIDAGCNVVQGYVFSEPKFVDDLVDQGEGFAWSMPLGVKKRSLSSAVNVEESRAKEA